MEFTNSRQLQTVMEFDRRETGASLEETREVMRKNDFASVKRYVITTTMRVDEPSDELMEYSFMKSMSDEDQVKKWRNDYSFYCDTVVTIQEDDLPAVTVHRSTEKGVDKLFELHHEWVKKTFDGIMR